MSVKRKVSVCMANGVRLSSELILTVPNGRPLASSNAPRG